ncbi:MAG: hypothetical protein ACPL7I_02850 [Myxococcota bacterium]
MADKEEKKNLSSIELLKKTERSKEEEKGEIGVEADIPMEDELETDSLNLSSNLKPNINVGTAKKTEDVEPPRGIEFRGQKVQVFNISSGRVVEKDILNQERESKPDITDNNLQKVSIPSQVRQSNKMTSAIKSEGSEGINNLWLIVGGLIIILALIYLLFGSRCGESKKEEIHPPAINLSK